MSEKEKTKKTEPLEMKTIFDGRSLKVFTYFDGDGNSYYVFRIPPFEPENSTILNEESLENLVMKLMEELQ